jgi:GTP-binding protein
MLDQATFELGVAQWDQLPTDGRPEIAFVGRSNVGKSSLLNALLNRKNLAYTSKTPGKTQQLNFFRVDNRFFAVDLPGYGYAKAPQSARQQWAQLQERYLHERPPLRGVALTKADKLSGNGRAQAEHRVDDCLDTLGLDRPVVLTSAETNRGIGKVRQWIRTQINA